MPTRPIRRSTSWGQSARRATFSRVTASFPRSRKETCWLSSTQARTGWHCPPTTTRVRVPPKSWCKVGQPSSFAAANHSKIWYDRNCSDLELLRDVPRVGGTCPIQNAACSTQVFRNHLPRAGEPPKILPQLLGRL